MKDIVEYLCDVLLIGCGIVFLVEFLIIGLTGRALFEPNPWILWTEVLMSIGIIIAGFNRLWGDW